MFVFWLGFKGRGIRLDFYSSIIYFSSEIRIYFFVFLYDKRERKIRVNVIVWN